MDSSALVVASMPRALHLLFCVTAGRGYRYLLVVSDSQPKSRTVVLDKKKFNGLGFVITSTPEGGDNPVQHYVKEIVPGKAAAASEAVFESDEIVEVNGVVTKGQSHQAVTQMLMSSEHIALLLRRGLVPANTSAADIGPIDESVATTSFASPSTTDA